MIRKKGFLAWPVYFDRSVSRASGRRLPVSLSIKNPSTEKIGKASASLGWKAEREEVSYPSTQSTGSGRVRVYPTNNIRKHEALRQIALLLKKQETSQ